MDLKTTYMGMELKNPIIVASSSLSKTLDGIQNIVDSGAGAVILKSLFEEQISAQTQQLEQHLYSGAHAESLDYIRNYSKEHSLDEYLDLLEAAKKMASIPIIASLNCVSAREWTDFATRIENHGADALELNIALNNYDPKTSGEVIEARYLEIVEKIMAKVSIPVSVKLGPGFSSLAHFARRLVNRGVKALVLFNRFYQSDIDIEKMELTSASPFSSPKEYYLSLRWIANLSGVVECDFSASTGIHDGPTAIKLLLAGAQTLQVCSTLYANKLVRVQEMLSFMEIWMKTHHYDSMASFQGKLSRLQSDHPEKYDRLQYIKALTGIE
ncbi:MAG: dihydroorotate dehydrogenase-like protein [Candidatus Marinimicrobia bacterium]|nr:dihydroorotate dehydrogenase-like protein [Candidatus Neomarinimicrobiota bacterium]